MIIHEGQRIIRWPFYFPEPKLPLHGKETTRGTRLDQATLPVPMTTQRTKRFPKLALTVCPLMLLLLVLSGCQSSPPQPHYSQPTTTTVANVPPAAPETVKTPTPAPTQAPIPKVPQQVDAKYLDVSKLRRVDTAINEAIAAGKAPGGVLWIERKGQVYRQTFGSRAVDPAVEPTTPDTIYDMASLTKVIATAPAIVKLHELGKLNIHDPVAKYLPDFAANDKGKVTLVQLLTHTSGLRPGLSLKPDWVGTDHAIKLACAESLRTEPGTQFKYSDINFILLGKIVEIASGTPLQQFAKEQFYEPLGMTDTGFLPRSSKQTRIAPTTVTPSGVTRGVVHDPTSARMGGVAGHAGLFSTAADLARYALMMLQRGSLENASILQPETVELMTRNHSTTKDQRGLGWDIASPYSSPRGNLFEIGSYGHTGWTGTSIWIDPFSETFIIFLSNRNHPTEEGSVVALRRTIATLVAEAVIGYEFPQKASASSPSQPQNLDVLNGIDVLQQEDFKALAGLKVGLITNHTGLTRTQQSTIDLLHEAPNVDLRVLFSPEHGIRGTEDAKVNDGRDEKTGLQIYSLYGATRKPKPEQLADLNALVFDIQDIGCRFYTYISTMGLAMEAAAEASLKFLVLDRINPITGSRVEGPILSGESSFVGYHPIPIRHGMSVGELAQLFKAEKRLELELEIIPVKGWKRDAWQDETSIPWKNPSPNMRSLTQAALYPGIGLIEFAAISVGRGTSTPFELIGAPYINADKLAREITSLELPGITVEAIDFTPDASKFANQNCHGLRFKITDRDSFHPIQLGLNLARLLHRDYPTEFGIEKIDRLLIHEATLNALRQGTPVQEIRRSWSTDRAKFLMRRLPHLLY